MKHWEIGERIVLPGDSLNSAKHGTILFVNEKDLILKVQLDEEFRTEKDPQGLVEISIDEYGIPDFGEEISRQNKEKSEVCFCQGCMTRIRIAAEVTTKLIEKLGKDEGYPDPKTIVKVAYEYADQLLYQHAVSCAPKHSEE